MSLRISVSMARCGQCGKRYSNPLTHVCVNPRGRGPRLQVRPRVSYDCPVCERPVTNPLTHVCKVRTDFRRRLADRKRQEKKPRPQPQQQQHDYRSCRDPDCQRRMCAAYREGFADGIDNCPGPHV